MSNANRSPAAAASAPPEAAAGERAATLDAMATDASVLDAAPALAPAPGGVDAVAFARLYGEPVFKLPHDLYIPPQALEVFLDSFEGPLDLLLYLIRRQNVNVLDIPMAEVTVQYLGYVEQIRRTNLELASDYLLMAAMLIEIKSRMLLPLKKTDSTEEVDDPRAELVRRLLEYEQMKLASQRLDRLPQRGRDFLDVQVHVEESLVPRWPDVSAADLHGAFRDMLRRARLVEHHRISREELSVREHMSLMLRRLQSVRFMEFTELFDAGSGVPVVVVNFIAMLELTREALIELTQAEPFAPIYVRLAYAPS